MSSVASPFGRMARHTLPTQTIDTESADLSSLQFTSHPLCSALQDYVAKVFLQAFTCAA